LQSRGRASYRLISLRDGGLFNISGGTGLLLVAAICGCRLMLNPHLTVADQALHGSPLQHERVEALPEIGR
jgi:hypothetical protein